MQIDRISKSDFLKYDWRLNEYNSSDTLWPQPCKMIRLLTKSSKNLAVTCSQSNHNVGTVVKEL